MFVSVQQAVQINIILSNNKKKYQFFNTFTEEGYLKEKKIFMSLKLREGIQVFLEF